MLFTVLAVSLLIFFTIDNALKSADVLMVPSFSGKVASLNAETYGQIL